MGVCETRWKRSSDITTEDHQTIYAGEEARAQCKSQEIIIVMGFLNAKVGSHY